jgi:hypothetical protein
MKRFSFVLIVLLLALALPPQGAWARDAQSADAAMQGFFEAMINHNSKALLNFFSPNSSFKLIPYLIGTKTPEKIATISYDRLKNDFANKKGWYVFFFEKPNGWTYNVEFRRGEPWKKKAANIFIPPDSSDGHTYIKWKQEGDKWVIAELAYVHP